MDLISTMYWFPQVPLGAFIFVLWGSCDYPVCYTVFPKLLERIYDSYYFSNISLYVTKLTGSVNL